MRKVQRAAALLLALLMSVTISACGGGGEEEGNNPSAEEQKFVYVPTYVKMPAEITEMQNCCWFAGGLYFTGSTVSGTESYTDPETGEEYKYDVYSQCLFYIKEDGTGLTKLENYARLEAPEGMEGDSYINRMIIDTQGNLWVLEYLYAYTPTPYPEEGPIPYGPKAYEYARKMAVATSSDLIYGDGGAVPQTMEIYYLRKLDNTGAELLCVDLSELAGSAGRTEEGMYYYFYPNSIEIDGNGNIFIATGQSEVFVLDPNGEKLCELSYEEGYLNNLIRLADGRVAAMIYASGADGMGKSIISVIDLETKSWGDSMDAPFNAYTFYAGGGDYDFYYNTDSNFFGAKLSSGESVKLFNWINCDIDNNGISTVIPLADGRVLCTINNWDNAEGKSSCELATLVKTDASQVAQKKILTYACMYMDYSLRREIINFNKTNGEYRIEVHDYSEYNTQEDYMAGLTKLSTEIIAGNVPDILSTGNLPVRQYAAKGLLEDLWPYIEADQELGGRAGLIEPVLKALEQDGKLYQITPSFSIYSAAGSSSIVGDTPGWTMDEMYEALAKLPEGAQVFNQFSTRNDILQQCCAMGMDEFVNWETGECKFDSQNFIKILEFANSFPEKFDYENYDWETDYESDYSRIKNGKQLLVTVISGDFQQFQMYKAMFGGNVTYIGFPNESRDGNAFMISSGLSMSSKCANKEGAWQFIRTVLTKEYQENNSWGNFPTNKEVFNARMEEAMTPNYYTDPVTGEKVEQPKGSWGWDRDLTVDIYAMTQEEVDQVLDLIESTRRIYTYDEKIFEIMNEETGAYFSGQKSAAETAKLIQNRISLYVSEQS